MRKLKLLFFTFLLEIINFVYTIPCSQENIGKYISDCLEMKRNIYFYWINECDQLDSNSIQLPTSILDTECKSCEKNEIIDYDFKENKIFCNKCPDKFYSSGSSFIMNGLFKDWNESNSNFKKFDNHCYIEQYSGELVDQKCKGWTPSSDNTHLIAGISSMVDSIYYSEMALGVNIINKGKIKFRYQKVNLSESYYNGSFRFMINYLEHLLDLDKSNDWIEVSYPLSSGYHTFLWQYSKLLNEVTKDYEKFYMKIELIEIEGLDSANTECRKCSEFTHFYPECKVCDENFYFDQQTNQCRKCDESKYSLPNSIGIDSCIDKNPCKESDYNYVIDEACVDNKHKKSYFFIEPKVCDDSKGVKLPREELVECLSCNKAQFINSEGKCEYCEEKGFYKNGDSCEKCENKKVVKMLILNNFNDDDLIKYFMIVKNWNIYKGSLSPSYSNKYSLNQIKSSYLEKEIDIVDDDGYIFLNITMTRQLEKPKEYLLVNIIEMSTGKRILAGEYIEKGNQIIRQNLTKGEYKVIIFLNILPSHISNKEPAIMINEIKIYNSNQGGGYNCVECHDDLIPDSELNLCVKCSPGTEKNKAKGECVKCKEGFFIDESYNKCLKCPPLTTSNMNMDGCDLNEVLNIEKSQRFIIKNLFESEQKSFCNSDEGLCYDNFIGPIITKKELSFISFKSKSFINITDFSYADTNLNKKGFIYTLKDITSSLINNTTDTNVLETENLQKLVNLGSQIESVKLFSNSSKNKKGFMIKYTHGDICLEDPSKLYNSYLIVNCYKDKENSVQTNAPRFYKKMNNNCTYVFEWKTRYGCPSCTKNELTPIRLPCVNGERVVYYRDNSECNIESPQNKIGENVSFDLNENVSMTQEEEIEFRFYFTDSNRILEDSNKTKTNEEDLYFYVDYPHEKEKCQYYEDFDNYVLIIVIVVPFIYIIIAVSVICYCIKLRRIRNQYERLVDEKDAPEAEHQTDRKNQKIELVYSIEHK